MSVIFSNAVLWPLAALIGVPILLHLFARARPPDYRFSSVAFIRKVLRSTMRVRRPQDWVLLVMRTLLFAALVLLFLRPLFFSKKRLSSAFEKKNVVLVIDATASMAYADGAQTRFASACAEASEILSGLSARDAANIVWLAAEPRSAFPELGTNLGYLQGELRRAGVTYQPGDIDEAIRMAGRMLSGAEGKRELCIVSDFQASAWQDAQTGVTPGIELVWVKVGEGGEENGAVAEVYCEPRAPLVGEETTLYCDVWNYSPQPRRRSVFVSVGESRLSKDLMIPAWGRATAVFAHRFATKGEQLVTASLNEDGYPGDDRRWMVVDVRRSMAVGLLDREPSVGKAWRKGLEALGWVSVVELTVEDLERELDCEVLLLAGWQGESVANLRALCERGATLVCLPGRTRGAGILALLDAVPADAPPTWDWERPSRPHRLRTVLADDPALRLFAGGEYGDITRGSFAGRLRVAADSLPEGGQVLLAYDDGVPALVRFPGRRHVILWNLWLAPELTTWAGHVEYVPFLGELLLSGRRRDAAGRNRSVTCGERLLFEAPQRVMVSDVELRDVEGVALPVDVHAAGRLTFVSSGKPPPGIYGWTHQGKSLARCTVNFPVRESDLRCTGIDTLEKQGGVAVAGGSKVRELRDGVKLWRHFLVLALGLAMAEGAFLLWFDGMQHRAREAS